VALPSGFSEFEHLQDIYRKVINQEVREEFSDQTWADTDPDLRTSRGALRWACTHKDDDSAAMTQMRTDLFYLILRKAADYHPAMYTLPVDTYRDLVSIFPQITLLFREDAEDVENGLRQLRSEVSFRLIGQNYETFSRADATAKGQKIKQLFGAGGGFRWKRGRKKCLYYDPARGYDFRLEAVDVSEAKRVIEQVLDINGHSPDWEHFSDVNKNKTYPTTLQYKTVLGKRVAQPMKGRIGYVRFRWAELKMNELANPVVICDLTGYWRNALVTA